MVASPCQRQSHAMPPCWPDPCLQLCPSAASVVDTCPVYAGPTYVAALAATKFAEDTYASISLQLCLKLKGFKKASRG